MGHKSLPSPPRRRLVRVGSPELKLSTAGRNGLAITITALDGPHCTVPLLSSSQVQLCLKAPPVPTSEPVQPTRPTDADTLYATEDRQAGGHKKAGREAGEDPPSTSGRTSVGAGPAAFSLHLRGAPGAPLSLQVPEDWERALEEVCGAAEAAGMGSGLQGRHRGRGELSRPVAIEVCKTNQGHGQI